MAHTYEAVISAAGRELFQAAFIRYMEDLGFEHMPAHGRLGGVTSHEFRRKDQSITLTVADFLEPFCETLSEGDPEQVLSSLITELRESFVRVLDKHG